MLPRAAENLLKVYSCHGRAFDVVRGLGIEQAKNASSLGSFSLRSQRRLGLVEAFPMQLSSGMIASAILGALLRVAQNPRRGRHPDEHFRIPGVGSIRMIALRQNPMNPMDSIGGGLRTQLHDFIAIQQFRVLGELGGIARRRFGLPPFISGARRLAVRQFQPDLIDASFLLDAPLNVRLQLDIGPALAESPTYDDDRANLQGRHERKTDAFFRYIAKVGGGPTRIPHVVLQADPYDAGIGAFPIVLPALYACAQCNLLAVTVAQRNQAKAFDKAPRLDR